MDNNARMHWTFGHQDLFFVPPGDADRLDIVHDFYGSGNIDTLNSFPTDLTRLSTGVGVGQPSLPDRQPIMPSANRSVLAFHCMR